MHDKPKKSLGQNFLVDKNVQRKIIEACSFKPCDTVLEIGAGRGELTGLIAAKAAKIYALEIDTRLCGILKTSLEGKSNVEIINQDVLKFNLRKHFRGAGARIKVFGNIPYYITTPIIGHLFKFREKIDAIFITVQQEFARRITAGPGSKDYGSFSCFSQYYTEPKILFTIKKNSFFPSPKVDSCLLRMNIKRKLPLRKREEDLLFRFIRAAFNKRRKTLKNSLKGVVSPQKLGEFFNRYSLDKNIRPEDLSLQHFINLTTLQNS
jgi:16S rRNA (adenine1518-N6/adenine1519-N6)-dimethyltransferase